MAKLLLYASVCLCIITSLSSCKRVTLEDKAERMAKEYTERNCPTPPQDMTITDSITFNRATKTFSYYYTLTDKADNEKAIDKLRPKLSKALIDNMKENTSLKTYKDASYNFKFIYRSQKSGQVLFEENITPKEYKTSPKKKKTT